MHQTKAWWPWVTSLLLAFIGCSSDSGSSGPPSGGSAATTSAPPPARLTTEQRRIFGFEDPASSDWVSDAGTVSRSPHFAEGASALSLQLPRGRTEVCSSNLSLPWKDSHAIEFKLWMQEPTRSFGEVQVVLRAAASGAAQVELAPVAIHDKGAGVFHTIVSPLRSRGPAVDADDAESRICIIIEAEAGRYVLDALRLSSPTPSDDSDRDATRGIGRSPLSRTATTFSSGDSSWPNLTSLAPSDALLAGQTEDETPLWSDAGTPIDQVPSGDSATLADGKADAPRDPRVALFELDDPDFCTTETLLPTAPFVSGITPLPNGTTIPYPICTAQQFATIITTSALWSKKFVLMGDINLSAASPAINPTGVQFAGVFDGNNRTLSNFSIQTTSQVGLFGNIGPTGVVRNLVLRDFVVRGIGRVGALAEVSDGLIDHVTGINLAVSGDSSSTQGVGGLVGRSGGTVSSCTASVNMVATSASNNIGGLVGFQSDGGQIVDCTVSGSVTRTGAGTAHTMGGAVGKVNRGVMINTHSSVNVSSTTGEVGGLAGVVSAGASVVGSSSSGLINAPTANAVGALVGMLHGSIASSASSGTVFGAASVGGLVGKATLDSTIVDSSAQGDVHATGNHAGGLVGQTSGAITTSWATGDVEGGHWVGGLTGFVMEATSSIDRSWASGSTSGTGNYVGGLVGQLEGQVDASYARGDVSGINQAGGLVGTVGVDAIVQDCASTARTVSGAISVGGLIGGLLGSAERCFATADVIGDTQVGGLVGAQSGDVTDAYATGTVTVNGDKVGGLVGVLYVNASVLRAYSAGGVTGTPNLGGFVGRMVDGSSLEDCHFNATENPGLNAVGNNPSVPGIAANSDSALRQEDTFVDWDFTEVWGILEGSSFPFLRPVPPCAEGGCGLSCPCPADTCTAESDCVFGQTCGENNGGYFDEDPDADVCWDPLCGTDQREQLCGAPEAPCGSCSGLGCDEGGCGPACPCDSGEGTCDSDSDCEAPAVCIAGNGPQYGHGPEVSVCQDPLCMTMAAFVGCGYEGAPCGDSCSHQVPCSAGCPAGYVCGENKGPLFGDIVADVCWPAECAVDPVEAGCGTVLSKCGVCSCEPSCADKTCGDDPDNGCGGYCTGLCDAREPGCTQDTDCLAGFACLRGGGPRVGEAEGTNVCLHTRCVHPDIQAPACGTVAAECGLCPAACEPECGGRECGVDPKCGTSCGECTGGDYCTESGQCQSSASDNDAPITVDDGAGGTRDIEPLDSPPANDVGATPGTFAVDALGNATYSLPIAVPPGRAGMEPQLAVQYSSATGNDLLGIGWSLGGLSAISRCGRTLARDGAPGGVRYDATDVYCLDGQRLVQLPGSINEFRTDIDSFSKIASYGAGSTGPTSFKVWTRDGRILSYGGAPNSRSYFSADLGGVRVWALDRIEDRARNRIDVQYKKLGEDQDGVTLEMVPERFWYGGNATLSHDRSVRFEYESRTTDIMEGFSPGGAPFVRSLRLQRIDTLVKDVVMRSYKLQYDEQVPNGVSRLKTLQECLPPASNPTCKPPTQFGYHWESPEFDQGEAFSVALLPSIVFDPDGDGDHDLKASGLWYNGGYHELVGQWTKFGLKVGSNVVLTYYGAGWAGPVANEAIDWFSAEFGEDEYHYIPPALYRATGNRADPVLVEAPPEDNTCIGDEESIRSGAKPLRGAVDLEGDGTDEVRALCNWRLQDECLYLDPAYALNRPTGFLATVPTPYPEWMADLNGDGLADHIRCEQTLEPDGDGRLSFALRDPASSELGGYATISAPRALCLPGCAHSAEATPTLVLDVDADGVENLVFFDGGWQGVFAGQAATGWQALVFADGALELVPVPGIPAPTKTHDILVADINGDGLRDVVKLSNLDNVNDDPVAVSLNTSRGFIPRTFDQADGFRAVAGTHRSWVHDYDRDGRDDILHPQVVTEDGSGYWLHIRLGGDGQRELLTTKLDQPEYPVPYVTADIDGDGNMDILGATSGTGLRIYYGRGNKNNLLTAVHDGADRRVDIEYTVNTWEDPECVSEWPIQCLPKSLRPLVDRYTEAHAPLNQNPLSGVALYPELVHDYEYYSPRVGLAGHGWQGFSKVSIQDFRCEVNCGSEGDGVRTNWTELMYEPVTPVPVDGGVVYPLAGKLRESISRTLPARSEIEDPATQSLYDQERSQFEWEVATSADGRPFPHLRQVYSTTSVSTADPDSGDLASSTTTTREVDGYGNVRLETKSSDPYYDSQEIIFRPPDRDNWLIALPERVTVVSRYSELPGKVRITDYTYDDGLVATITVQPEDLQLKLVTTLFRDEMNNVDHVTYADAAGNLREQFLEYDDSGIFTLLSYDGRLQATQYRYDERHGEVTLVVDPNGIETKFAYDGFGRLREVVAPEGRATFDFADSFDSGTAPEWVRASYKIIRTTNGFADSETEIDAFGRVGRTITHGYDGQSVFSENVYKGGLLFRSTRPHLLLDQSQGYTEYTYDAADRLIHVRHPDGRSEQRLYANSASLAEDYWDWMATWDPTYIVASVAPNGERDVLVTDQRGNPRTSVDAIGNRTEYLPDAFNGLYRIIDAERNETYVFSDAFNRTLLLRDPARGDNYFDYSAFGETIGHFDGNGELHQYFYDEVGRLERIEDTDGATVFTYDGTGPNEIDRLVSATSPDGHVTAFEYQPPETGRNRGLLENIHRTVQGETFTETVEYDERSRVVAHHYPASAGSGFGVSYHYNAEHGYLEAIRDAATSTNYWRYISSYQGYRVQVDGQGGATDTERTFDPLTGQLQRIQTVAQPVLSPEVVIHDVSYTHDDNYNLRTRTDELGDRGTDTFFNDRLDRLDFFNRDRPGAVTETIDYGHDTIGNLTYQTNVGPYNYSSPDSDEGYLLRSAGTTIYSYDGNGAMISRLGALVHNSAQNVYLNAEGLPKRIEMPAAEQTVDFEYSAFGERAAKLSPADASGITLYAGDGYRREQPDPSVDNYLHHYRVFAGGRQVAQVTRAETDGTITNEWTQYLHHDLLGSVEVISSEAGEVVHSQQFDPYGNVDEPAWSLTGILSGFTGHEHDPDLGLINMKGRLFDGTIGRFISADPYVQSPLWGQGLNRYSYGYNNPMSGSDPSGYGWLDKVFGDSSGYEGSAFFAGGLGITGGAYLSTLSTVGQFSGLGGAIGIGQAAYGLNDPGANAKYARPTGELGSGAVGSQGGLYNENAGAAPPRAEGAVACPACIGPGSFANEEQYHAWLKGVAISNVFILTMGRAAPWILARLGLGASDIALGMQSAGLEAFAKETGAVAMGEWRAMGLYDATVKGWGEAFTQAVTRTLQGGGRIRFSLKGVDVSKALAGDANTWVGRYTSWELQQIMASPAWRAATTFYNTGHLTAAELAALGL